MEINMNELIEKINAIAVDPRLDDLTNELKRELRKNLFLKEENELLRQANEFLWGQYMYRTGFFEGYIFCNGIEEYVNDIFEGMNNSNMPEVVCNPSDMDIEEFKEKVYRENSAFMQWGVDYIERWIMYNGLFKEIEKESKKDIKGIVLLY